MNATELDTAYTALAQAMTSAGEARTPLLLSMVTLALMSEQDSLSTVLEIIARAEQDVGG